MKQDLIDQIEQVRQNLLQRLHHAEDQSAVLRSVELKALYEQLPRLSAPERAAFGKALNDLKQEITAAIAKRADQSVNLPPIDITAPFAANTPSNKMPALLPGNLGSIHPIAREMEKVTGLFMRMGFSVMESREIDDDWHMFGSLNFPEGHPARDDYDTFMTEQTDQSGKSWIAPAHTSSMQNRALKAHLGNLEHGEPIAVVIPGRVFRNEDVDARHEHTFYQLEGVFVGPKVSIGNLLATLKTFLESYYRTALETRTQPSYFPFTEPSLEFAMSCPFCSKRGCHICSQSGWIELIGCGQIHPDVLNMAGIDPVANHGFAWGIGIERLIMLKYAIEDVRLFESGRLDFLRQFPPEGVLG